MAEILQTLAGVRVLDLSRALAGPYCAMLLGDLGAEVIKVENPSGGDETRSWGPPFLNGESAYYLSTNRNKKGVTINIRSAPGVDLLTRLARECDVLIENFGPEIPARYGFDFPTLHGSHPGLIYCSITSFVPGSRYESLPGYDFVIQAMSGLMSITGAADGDPQKVGVAIVDLVTGLYASNAVLAALYQRRESGIGRQVNVSLFDAALASLVNVASNFLVTGVRPLRWGNAHANLSPYQTFRTSDGMIAIGVGNDAQFERLCTVLGRPEISRDERFLTNPERVRHRAALDALLSTCFRERGVAGWTESLNAARVPAAPVNCVDETFADPYLADVGMVQSVAHPTAGDVPLVSNPIMIDGARLPVRLPPPTLGERTAEVLQQILGMGEEEIQELRRAGAL